MKTDPHITFAYALVGLVVLVVGVLAGLHTTVPEVLPTLALVLAGGGVGATLPRSPVPGPGPGPVAAVTPTSAQVADFINTTLAQVQRPAAAAAAPAPRQASSQLGPSLVGSA